MENGQNPNKTLGITSSASFQLDLMNNLGSLLKKEQQITPLNDVLLLEVREIENEMLIVSIKNQSHCIPESLEMPQFI